MFGDPVPLAMAYLLGGAQRETGRGVGLRSVTRPAHRHCVSDLVLANAGLAQQIKGKAAADQVRQVMGKLQLRPGPRHFVWISFWLPELAPNISVAAWYGSSALRGC